MVRPLNIVGEVPVTEKSLVSSLDSSSPSAAEDSTAAYGIGYVEGEYMPVDEARISIRENGFDSSDCTYDVVGVWDGAFFRLEDHLDRLFRGCEILMLEPPADRQEIREMMFEMVRRAGLRNAYVQVIITRGVPSAEKLRDPRQLTPQMYGYTIPYLWILAPDKLEGGLDLVIAKSVTRIPTSSVDPTVKNYQRGDFVRGQFEAYDRGGNFCLLTDGLGLLTEGAGYNLFALVDGTLYTPSNGCLLGITRRVALEIAKEMDIPTVVGSVPVEFAERAEEIFVTSTAGGIIAAATLDGRPVGAGKEGPTTRKIRERYWELHYHPSQIEPVDYNTSAPR
jgi:branched-subunit amino acid aminotransferase/4-amino-4-deoxychorismate lyase